MAETFQGLAVLSKISIIFVILFVWILVFGMLEKIKPMGPDKKNLHALIALAMAFLTAISGSASFMIEFMTTWFFVLALFVFLIIFVIGMFGVDDKAFQAAGKNPQVYFWLITFGVIIGLFAFGQAFGQRLLEQRTGPPPEGIPPEEQVMGPDGMPLPPALTPTTAGSTFGGNVLTTMTHPKILGFILIMLIGTFTIWFLTR